MLRTRRLLIAMLGTAAIITVTAPSQLVAENHEPKQVLITNVDVWDGTNDSVKKGVDVLVEGNMIKQVAAGIKGKGAQVIDGKAVR